MRRFCTAASNCAVVAPGAGSTMKRASSAVPPAARVIVTWEALAVGTTSRRKASELASNVSDSVETRSMSTTTRR